MKEIFLDFETRSLLDLREYGVDKYVHNSSTEMLSLAWLEGQTGICHIYLPPFAPEIELDKWFNNHPVMIHRELPTFPDDALYIAHNALGFDEICMQRWFGKKPNWFDTMLAAKIAGKPGALGKLTHKEDAAEMKVLSFPKGGKFVSGNKVIWKKFSDYNIGDIVALVDVYNQYHDYYEPKLIQVHQRINARGIPINCEWVSKLVLSYEAYKKEVSEEIAEFTDINMGSSQQVKNLLEQNGFRVHSIQQKFLKDFFLDPNAFKIEPIDHGLEVFEEPTTVINLLNQRRELTRALGGKLARVLVMEREGRLRYVFNHYGAHTGRWSGRGFQPHNFAKPIDKEGFNPEILLKSSDPMKLLQTAKQQAKKLGVRVSDIYSSLQRTVIQAPEGMTFLIADYSAIEARAVAWLARQETMLEAFRLGRDIYQEFADKIGCSRWLAKQIILGCTYGMSAKTFKVFCYFSGVDLDALGFDSVALVQSFRDTYSEIRSYWHKVNRLVLQTVQTGRTHEINGVTIWMLGQILCITLPSERTLYYHNAFIQDVVTNWGTIQPVVHYQHHHGSIRKLWGGLITENISQGICRDILADGIIENEEREIPIVMHVHDEMLGEVEEKRARGLLPVFIDAMKTAERTWAKGFPIDVKGFISPVYFKKPIKRMKGARG